MRVRLTANVGYETITEDIDMSDDSLESDLRSAAEEFYWVNCTGWFDWEILGENE